jgi:hypothetical protein
VISYQFRNSKVISRWIVNTNTNHSFFLFHEPQTPSPTTSPTPAPTLAPVPEQPTLTPVPGQPTLAPVTGQPTASPTKTPTPAPTGSPSTATPTDSPSSIPSSYPSEGPTPSPSSTPSVLPSNDPSGIPSSDPSSYPSEIPTTAPTEVPSVYPSAFPSASPSITIICNGRTVDQREEALFEIVSEFSDSNLLEDPTTNEYRAFRWLVDDDGMRVCPEDILDVTQRYVMSLLYYSTQGDMWDQCSAASSPTPGPCAGGELARHLGNVDVCFWHLVFCKPGGNAIDVISIGKS